jgi:hypothetical protein
MTSILKVDQIQLSNGTTPTTGDLGLNTTGNVLQVQSFTKTDTSSHSVNINTSYASYANTGISCSITPTYANSKILVNADISVGLSSGSICVWVLKRDSSYPVLGNAASGYYQVTTLGRGVGGNIHGMHHSGLQYLDSPATTSSVTYTILGASENGQIVYVNGSGGQDLSGQAWSSRGTSTITLMEIAG